MIYEDLGYVDRSYWIAISQCAWCNGIKLGPFYVRIPGLGKVTYQQGFRLPLGFTLRVTTTHGLCPSCAESVCGKALHS